MEMVLSFLDMLSKERVVPLQMDKIKWNGDASRYCSMKRCFSKLEVDPLVFSLFNLFWNKTVPSKIGYLAWEVW